MIKVNSVGFNTAKRLIREGKVNTSASWSFDAADGNALLGSEGNDWANYGAHHLAIDTEATPETRAYYKYPVAKNGTVYRSGVIAAKQRAAQQNVTGLTNAADDLKMMIDNKEKKSLKDVIMSALMTVMGLVELSTDEMPEMDEMHETEDEPLKGEYDPYTEEYTKSEVLSSVFQIAKDLKGEYRFFSWVSNKWIDRDGDILTEAAHKEYIEFLDKYPQHAPEVWLWHTPGTAHKNKVDWWGYHDGFLMFSGKLTDEEAMRYKSNDEPLGMSHGFWRQQKYGRYINKYRTFEISILPLSVASNTHTAFITMEENMSTKGFDPRRRNFLVDKLGEDTVAQLEANTEKQAEILEAAGFDQKALDDEFNAEIEAERQKAAQPIIDAVIKAFNPEELQLVLKEMSQKLAKVEPLEKEVNLLKAEIAALKELEDAKLAEAFTPVTPFVWGLSARKGDVEPEDNPVETPAKKDFSWVEELK